MYDPTMSRYIAALGNGAICTIKRKDLKISQYVEVHGQRIVDAVLGKPNDGNALLVTASNDLSLGLSTYNTTTHKIETRAKVQIAEAPNAIMLVQNAIYVADTGNDINRIVIKY